MNSYTDSCSKKILHIFNQSRAEFSILTGFSKHVMINGTISKLTNDFLNKKIISICPETEFSQCIERETERNISPSNSQKNFKNPPRVELKYFVLTIYHLHVTLK